MGVCRSATILLPAMDFTSDVVNYGLTNKTCS